MSQLTSEQREALRAFCDTVVPSVDAAEDPHGFWRRTASDLGVPEVAEMVMTTMPAETFGGLASLLEAFFQAGITGMDATRREQLLGAVAGSSPQAGAGVGSLIGLTLYLHYGLPDQDGRNPNWPVFGYPGPLSLPPETEKPIHPFVPAEDCEIDADVCVVGSGAGGGVIAGTLARRGLKVVVLEAGGYFDESDFSMLEIPAYQQLYWRGGPTPTADLNVSLQAGSCLGGGTVINWTNCLRTHPWVREEWAAAGLTGVDGPEYDRLLDGVFARLGVTDACSDPNGPTQRLREGAERLGWSFRHIVRNADPETYSPETAAFMGFGDQSGSKRSTTKTYLADAVEAGAEVLVRTRAERVLVSGGGAAGVEAVFDERLRVVVRAPRVVVACGALESPALLLRSGMGGPAVGQHLRLHPCTALIGLYENDQQAWWGAPHTGLIDEHANVEDGHGFLLETAQYTTAVGASAIPWTSGREHKEMLADYGRAASFIALLRDHGSGRVTIDRAGAAVPWYSLVDELDVRNARRGLEAMARVHEAAGAVEIAGLCAGLPRWRRGESLPEFVSVLQSVPLAAGGHRLFSAHQMGTCRMGADRETSVANPDGELWDVPGVWIGDGSAFPSASGTNPMISIMALASRTAEAVAASSVSAGAASAH
jgi:choline dehydrogenase-like flavoprotein